VLRAEYRVQRARGLRRGHKTIIDPANLERRAPRPTCSAVAGAGLWHSLPQRLSQDPLGGDTEQATHVGDGEIGLVGARETGILLYVALREWCLERGAEGEVRGAEGWVRGRGLSLHHFCGCVSDCFD
jgi:hypothetical protein